MKRKLSLLLSLMMVLTLIPMSSFADTANRVNRVVSVTSDGNTVTNTPDLVIKNDKGDMQVNDIFWLTLSADNVEWDNYNNEVITSLGTTRAITEAVVIESPAVGAPFDYSVAADNITFTLNGQVVLLDQDYSSFAGVLSAIDAQLDATITVGAGATTNSVIFQRTLDVNNLTVDADPAGLFASNIYSAAAVGQVIVNRESNSILSVRVNSVVMDSEFRIPLRVDLNGAAEGPVEVTIDPRGTGVSPGKLTFATVGAGDAVLRTDSKVKISRSGGNVSFIINEVVATTFDSNPTYTFRLPRDFSWSGQTMTSPTLGNLNTNISVNPTNDRELIVNLTGVPAAGTLDSLIVSAAITPNRSARLGDVEVQVVRGNLSPRSFVPAEYVDYVGMVSVDKVLDVVSGRNDEDNLYVAKLTIEEPVANSLLTGRYIEFSFDKGIAALQHNGTLRVTPRNGNLNVQIENTSSRALGGGARSLFTQVNVNPNATASQVHDAHAWDLFVGTPVGGATPTRTKLELEVPFVVSAAHEGDVVLTVKGAGIESQEIVVAKATKPVKVEVSKDSADLKVGLQRQDAPDIIITETQAGALSEGALYTIRSTSDYNINWTAAKIEVIEGDLELRSSGTGRDANGIDITVDAKSTKPSTIKISGVQVTLDRTVPFGPFNIDFTFGAVQRDRAGRLAPAPSGSGIRVHKNLSDTVATLPYFNVVTPVQDTQRMTAVFTIGDANYTVNGEVMTLDAAPFIQNNRTMLPIGAIAQIVGASVNYSVETRTAVFIKDGIVVSMTLDQPFLTANGVVIPMDSAPVVVNSRAFVPMAFVAQAFGVPVQYDAAARTVTVN